SGFLHIDPVSGSELGDLPAAGSSGFGMAVDGYGRLWYSAISGSQYELHRIDPVSGEVTPVLDGFLTLSSGSTSAAVLDAGRRRGSWKQVIDGGGYSIRWGQVSWSEHAPENTRVAALVRFADSEDGLDASTFVCGPFDGSPAD